MDGKEEGHYQDIKDAGFNVVMGAFGANTPDTVRRQLELCDKYGMKALVWTRGAMEGIYPDADSCWGYMIQDEPTADQFPEIATRVNQIRERAPGKLAFVNLLPDYADNLGFKDEPGITGINAYDEYVKRFINEVHPDLLSMDHYPTMRPDQDGRWYYLRNLAVMRKYALQQGIPFWNFFNTQMHGGHTDPTEAQLRWQVYMSLAYGARGILYFCYWTPAPGFGKYFSLITPDGKKTRHYYQAQRLNASVSSLGPVLMQLTSTSVLRIGKNTPAPEKLLEAGLKSASRVEASDPALDYVAGAFTREGGGRALLVVNYDIAYTSLATFAFDAPPEQVLEVSKDTGEPAPVVDDSPGYEGLQLSFDSGEGRLFLFP